MKKPNLFHLRETKTASALIITLLFLVAMGVALEAVHSYTTSTHRATARNGDYLRQSEATDAGLEIVIGRLIQWVTANGGFTPSIADCNTAGVPGNPLFPAITSTIIFPTGSSLNDFVFSKPIVEPVLPDDSVVTNASDAKYLPNLVQRLNIPETSMLSPARYYFTRNASQNAKTVQARSMTYRITMTVSPKVRTLTTGSPITLVRYLRCDKISPFTWASYRTGSGLFNTESNYLGPVYVANDALLNGPAFSDSFLYGGSVTDTESSWLGAGKDAQLKQSSLLSLIPSLTSALQTDNTNKRLASYESDTTSPSVGQAAPADKFSTRELIEPPTNPANDLTPATIKNARIYNQADVRIKIKVDTVLGLKVVTKTVVNVDGSTVNPLTNLWVVPLLLAVNTQALPDNSPLSFIDRSRSSTQAVQCTNINVGLLKVVMDLFPTVFPTGVIYAWDATGLDGNGTRPLTGMRLWNAGILPNNGLVLGTNDPVYLKGDFNTGTLLPQNALIDDLPLLQPRANYMGTTGTTTAADRVVPGYTVKPAGVFGDSLTELSNAWTDLLSRNTIPASSTTYNLVEGWSTMRANELRADDTFADASRATPIWIEDWQGKRRTMSGEEFVCWHSRYGQTTTQVGGFWSGDTTYDPRITALKLNWGTVSFVRDRLTRL